MSSFYCVVSFPLGHWNLQETDDLIVDFCKQKGYNRIGSGAGFGYRDLEFDSFQSKDEFRQFEKDLKEQFTFITDVTFHDYD